MHLKASTAKVIFLLHHAHKIWQNLFINQHNRYYEYYNTDECSGISDTWTCTGQIEQGLCKRDNQIAYMLD